MDINWNEIISESDLDELDADRIRRFYDRDLMQKVNERMMIMSTPQQREISNHTAQWIRPISYSGLRPTLTILDDTERQGNTMLPPAPRPEIEPSDYKLLSNTYEESLNLSVTTFLNRGYKTLGLPYSVIIPTFDNRGFQNGSVVTHYQAVIKKGTDA